MNRYTLVIVDMQTGFIDSDHDFAVISGVIRAIKKAKKNLSDIIVVEYSGSGKTLPDIMRTLRGYRKVHRVQKHKDDGSVPVLRNIRRNGLGLNLRVCGVNLDACVRRTVWGLVEKSAAEVKVLKQATNSSSYRPHVLRDMLISRVSVMDV